MVLASSSQRGGVTLTNDVVDDQVSDSDASGSTDASPGGAPDTDDGTAHVHQR